MITALDNIAEIRFPQTPVRLYGHVAQRDAYQMAISLVTFPRNGQYLSLGGEVEIAYRDGDGIASAVGQIAALQGEMLGVTFIGAPPPDASSQKRAFELPMQFRSMRAVGRSGAWLDATIVHLDSEGLTMVLEASSSVSDRMEVLFFLPVLRPNAKGICRMYNDDGSVTFHGVEDARPVRVEARRVSTKTHDLTRMQMSIAFTSLSPSEKSRLQKFAMEV